MSSFRFYSRSYPLTSDLHSMFDLRFIVPYQFYDSSSNFAMKVRNKAQSEPFLTFSGLRTFKPLYFQHSLLKSPFSTIFASLWPVNLANQSLYSRVSYKSPVGPLSLVNLQSTASRMTSCYTPLKVNCLLMCSNYQLQAYQSLRLRKEVMIKVVINFPKLTHSIPTCQYYDSIFQKFYTS